MSQDSISPSSRSRYSPLSIVRMPEVRLSQWCQSVSGREAEGEERKRILRRLLAELQAQSMPGSQNPQIMTLVEDDQLGHPRAPRMLFLIVFFLSHSELNPDLLGDKSSRCLSCITHKFIVKFHSSPIFKSNSASNTSVTPYHMVAHIIIMIYPFFGQVFYLYNQTKFLETRGPQFMAPIILIRIMLHVLSMGALCKDFKESKQDYLISH